MSSDVVPFLGSNMPLKELVDGVSFTSENTYVNYHDDGVKAHFQIGSLRNWTNCHHHLNGPASVADLTEKTLPL